MTILQLDFFSASPVFPCPRGIVGAACLHPLFADNGFRRLEWILHSEWIAFPAAGPGRACTADRGRATTAAKEAQIAIRTGN